MIPGESDEPSSEAFDVRAGNEVPKGRKKGASSSSSFSSFSSAAATATATAVQAGVISFEAVKLRQDANAKTKGRGKLSRSAAAKAAAAFDGSGESGSDDASNNSSSSGGGGRRGGKHKHTKGGSKSGGGGSKKGGRHGKRRDEEDGDDERGGGGGRHGSTSTSTSGVTNSKVKCYFCGRRGHVQEECADYYRILQQEHGPGSKGKSKPAPKAASAEDHLRAAFEASRDVPLPGFPPSRNKNGKEEDGDSSSDDSDDEGGGANDLRGVPGVMFIDAAFNLRPFVKSLPFYSTQADNCSVDDVVKAPMASAEFPLSQYKGAIVYESIDDFIARALGLSYGDASLHNGLLSKHTLGYVLSIPSLVDLFLNASSASAEDAPEASEPMDGNSLLFEELENNTELLATIHSSIVGYEFVIDSKNVELIMAYCSDIAEAWGTLSSALHYKPVVFTLSPDVVNVAGALTAIHSIVSSAGAAETRFLVRLGGNKHLFSGDVVKTLVPLRNVTFAFDGRLTHAKQKVLLELIFDIPMNRIIFESNAPLFPVSAAAQAGGPEAIGCTSHVVIVADACANIKRVSLKEVLQAAFVNTIRLFGLTPDEV